MLNAEGRFSLVAKSIGNRSKEFSGYGSQQARELAPELWGLKGRKLQVETIPP